MRTDKSYRLENSKGQHVFVYQHVDSAGNMSIRFENRKNGRIVSAMVQSPDSNYVLYPQSRRHIDTTNIARKSTSLDYAQVNIFGRLQPDTAQYLGKKGSHRVEYHIVRANLEPPPNAEPSSRNPDSCVIHIQESSYLPMKVIFLNESTEVAAISLTNFAPLPKDSSQLFIVPKDYISITPDSEKELAREMIKSLVKAPRNMPDGYAFDETTRKIVMIDSKTGAHIPIPDDIASRDAPTSRRRPTLSMFLALNVIALGAVLAITLRNRSGRGG